MGTYGKKNKVRHQLLLLNEKRCSNFLSLSSLLLTHFFFKLRTNKLLAVGVFYFFTDSQRLEVLALRASSPYIVHVKYSEPGTEL